MLAGLGSGVLKSLDDLEVIDEGKLFEPNMTKEERQRLKKGWRAVLEKALSP
jgi:glycerol kinase